MSWEKAFSNNIRKTLYMLNWLKFLIKKAPKMESNNFFKGK